MNWKIGEAKQRFSEVVRAAEDGPQRIYHRERLVAGVVDAETLEDYLAWRDRRGRRTVADAFAELRELLRDEPNGLTIPEREDRENAFDELLDRVPG
jgi:antitoxin (DNA-binding transcriptional repressor) of toxin-antitoxin stability system